MSHHASWEKGWASRRSSSAFWKWVRPGETACVRRRSQISRWPFGPPGSTSSESPSTLPSMDCDWETRKQGYVRTFLSDEWVIHFLAVLQDSLYHHPVHKISFIAQDMSDSRAFGYIFGSPDTGHRFFGIKTDKAASQVRFWRVDAMYFVVLGVAMFACEDWKWELCASGVLLHGFCESVGFWFVIGCHSDAGFIPGCVRA